MARPKKEIDWDRVERKMQAGCTLVEIAGHFRIHPDHFCVRFKEQYGDVFTSFLSSFHSDGKGNVRETQYEEALDGNTQMLLLLGKLWLGQVDIEPEPKNTDNFNAENEIMEKNNTIQRLENILKQHNIEIDVQDKPEAE
jgi:hypothetical protein